MKIKVKNPPIISVLKPETNSDSPSEKSKGERLDSAKQQNSHTKKIGIEIIKNGKEFKNIFVIFILFIKLKNGSKIKKITTS